MNYFDHHIGDYRRDTAHLSLLEHGIYRQLLDTYYMDEKPLTDDIARLMRSHCVRTADEQRALENVLQDFFTRTEEGYRHKRCDVVIEAYHKKSSKAGESAKARWDRVRAEKEKQCLDDANAMRTQCEGNANHKPITNNHKPITIKKREATQRASRLPEDWSPTDADIEFCKSENHMLSISEVTAKFRDYWLGTGGKKIDWSATWRNWVRNEKSTVQARASPGKPEKFDPTAYVNQPRSQKNNERTIEFDAVGEPI